MLLQQKVYAEGSLSLCLYASSLFEDSHTAPTEAERADAARGTGPDAYAPPGAH